MSSTEGPGAGSDRRARIARATGVGALLLVGAWAGAGGVARLALARPAGGSGWALLGLFAVSLVAAYWVWRGDTTARKEVLRFALTWPALYLAFCGQFLLFPSMRPAVWLFPPTVVTAEYAAGWRLLVAGGAIFAVVAALASRGASAATTTPSGANATSAERDASIETATREATASAEMRERGVVRCLRFALAVAAVAVYVYNLGLGRGSTSEPRSVTLWLVGIGLILASQMKLPGPRRRRDSSSAPAATWFGDATPRLVAAGAMSLVLLVALGLRMVDLDRLPLDFHGDSASMGLGGRELLSGRVSDLFGTGWAALPWSTFLPAAFTLRVFSNDLPGLLMSGVLAGTASVLACYLLAAFHFGRAAGVVAAAIVATSYVAIHFSRLPAYMDPVPWVLFGLYWLLRGLYSGRTGWFALAGVSLAFSFTLYYSGRIGIVLAAVAVACFLALEPRRTVRAWRGIVLFVIALVVTYGPSLADNIEHSHEFFDRTRQVWLFDPGVMAHSLGKYNTSSVRQVVLEQTRLTVLMFNHTVDSSTQFGFPGPFLHPFLAPFLVLGAAACLLRLHRPLWAVPLLWLLAVMTLGSVLTVDAPFWPRLVLLLGPASLLVAAGVRETLAALAAPLPRARWVPVTGTVLTSVLLLVVGVSSWRWYRQQSGTYVGERTWLARVIAATPAEEGFCMVEGPFAFREREFEFLLAGRAVEDFPPSELSAGIDGCAARHRTWALYLPEHQQVLAALQLRWPAGTLTAYPTPRGARGPSLWRPPPVAGSGGGHESDAAGAAGASPGAAAPPLDS